MVNEFVFRAGPFDDLYGLHQMVWKIVRRFVGDHARFLFREVGGLVKVRTAQAVSGIQSRNGVSIEAGRECQFDVYFNAVKSVKGVRFPLANKSDVIASIRKKLEASGFSVMDIDGAFMPGQRLHVPGCRPYSLMVFHAIGRVVVTDAAKAKYAYENGIGKAKRFGCGMLELMESKQ